MLHHLALVVLLAAAAQASPKQQYRLVNLNVNCGPAERCPATGTSGKLEIQYGEKNPNLFGEFEVVYKQTGDVDFKITARGAGQNTVYRNNVILGNNENGGRCRATGSNGVVSFNNVGFHECAFDQTFNGNYVKRSITVCVRQQFNTGAVSSSGRPVLFIGYRDILVEFFLEPVNPEEPIVPVVVPRHDYDLDVCVELTHTLTTYQSDLPYFWHLRVSHNNYVPALLGLGFKLEECWAVPYRVSLNNQASRTGDRAYFLKNGILDRGVLFDPSSNPAEINELAVTAGQSYEFSFHQLTLNSVPESDLVPGKTHQIHCSVCLCNLNGGANACPTTIPVDWIFGAPQNGRSAFKPYRLINGESAQVAPGMARQV